MWTKFWDMHSGGYVKETNKNGGEVTHIYIEAYLPEALEVFEKRFSHDPYDVACSCCGQNYAVDEGEDIDKLTEYHREDIKTIDYLLQDNVIVMTKEDIENAQNDNA